MKREEFDALIELVRKAELIMVVTKVRQVGLAPDMQEFLVKGLESIKSDIEFMET